MTKTAILIVAFLLPSLATAHPQHVARGSEGLAHFVTDPFHVLLTAGAVLIAVAVRRVVLQRFVPNRFARSRHLTQD